MNILHISSSYANQELYSQMLLHLAKKNVRQFMYAPIRKAEQNGANRIKNNDALQVKYSYVLRKYHRLFFHCKIRAMVKDLKKNDFLKRADVVHAHFLFSDGAVALKLKEAFGIPFVVSVRNTDINIFFKYLKHLGKLGNKILLEADAVIFITPKYIDPMIENYIPTKNQALIQKKIKIIPNGLNAYWVENINPSKQCNAFDQLRLIFVGKFNKGKNVDTIIKAVKKLSNAGHEIHLTLVGGGGNKHGDIIQMVNENRNIMTFLGKIQDKDRLLNIYRENDIFIMPSLHETFGMVYIEAMSQGLPCIYTRGQGIDGYFTDGKIGYSVNPYDIDEIVEKIYTIKERYAEIAQCCIREVEKFNWDLICGDLMKVYENTTA